MANQLINKDLITYPEEKISFQGPFFIEILSILGLQIKRNCQQFKSARSKLFKLFIELSQNVAHYSEDRFNLHNQQSIGIGKLSLIETQETFAFSTQNLVSNSDAIILYERCKLLNQSSEEELRELKREMRQLEPSIKYGARIGLIQAVLLSNNPLKFSIKKISKQHSLFSITITIDKL